MQLITLALLLLLRRCHSSQRDQILQAERLLSIGGNITLTDQEIKVNNFLMQNKHHEIDYAFNNPQYFNFTYHFFKYKTDILNSKVYKFIRRMPKGAALHLHDMGILGPDYLMNITYMSHLYVCFETGAVRLKFLDRKPSAPCNGQWTLMSEARRLSKDVKKLDADLREHFTLVVRDPAHEYPSIKDSWEAFMTYFTTIISMVTYRPVWEQYFYDVLKAFREVNIMYVEVRSLLPVLYELDGTTYDEIITAKAYKKSIQKFVKDYPDFIGAKIIFAPSRHIDEPMLESYLDLARRIKAEEPYVFAGFDLVGLEDKGRPLKDFLTDLEAAADNLTYFFHAGETNWYGTSTDENLVDAILLGAKRIGHGYALPKHPLLVREILKRDIGIEVNVISNSVLSLVQDLRNHPLASFIAQGLPVVISSDDPGVWEADLISEDFYVAFVGVASRWADLKLLKQLAINSLKYSALSDVDKISALQRFHTKWNKFIDNFDYSTY